MYVNIAIIIPAAAILIVGGIIIPTITTLIPLARSCGKIPWPIALRIAMRGIVALYIIRDIVSSSYSTSSAILAATALLTLLFVWHKHPDKLFGV